MRLARSVVLLLAAMASLIALASAQSVGGQSLRKTVDAASAKPWALLVRNPSTEAGAPPFALADQSGKVLRLIEPSPGVRLDPYVGQVVGVKHDTGGTLLASQLELPEALLRTSSTTKSAGLGSIVTVQHEAESLPDPPSPPSASPAPIQLDELEEIQGEPDGPVVNGLRFPAGFGPALSDSPPAATPACVDCGAPIIAPLHPTITHPTTHCASCACDRAGLDFSLDLLHLRVHDSAAISGGDEFEFGSRWELGYQGTEGRRLAIRYFEFDSGLNGPAGNRLDLETIDLEFQRRARPHPRVEWGVGGGLRWAEYDEAAGLAYSDSIGPLISAFARAPAFRSVDGTVLLRQSFQFGDPSRAGRAADRGAFSISELQFGLEHRRQRRIGELLLRGTFEAQYWDGVGNSPAAVGGESSRGLIGFGLGVGLLR